MAIFVGALSNRFAVYTHSKMNEKVELQKEQSIDSAHNKSDFLSDDYILVT
jgi:hypothetical protein